MHGDGKRAERERRLDGLTVDLRVAVSQSDAALHAAERRSMAGVGFHMSGPAPVFVLSGSMPWCRRVAAALASPSVGAGTWSTQWLATSRSCQHASFQHALIASHLAAVHGRR